MKKLYRSRKNNILGGVCGGIGEFTDIDPTIIRILLLVLLFGFGIGFYIYLLCWLWIPKIVNKRGEINGHDGFNKK